MKQDLGNIQERSTALVTRSSHIDIIKSTLDLKTIMHLAIFYAQNIRLVKIYDNKSRSMITSENFSVKWYFLIQMQVQKMILENRYVQVVFQ